MSYGTIGRSSAAAERDLPARLRRATSALLAAVLCAAISPSPARGQPDADAAFASALSLERAGRLEEAVPAYEAIAIEQPESPKAPEALFRAASIVDGSLGPYRAAIELYSRIASTYPTSPPAARARLRQAELEKYALPNEIAFRTYERAIQERARGELGAEEARRRLATLAEEHPAAPITPLALVALARDLERVGKKEEASSVLRQVLDRHPTSEAAPEARIVLGDMAFAEGRYEEAIEHYSRLAREGDLWRGAAERLGERVSAHLFRRRIFRLCLAMTGLFAAAVAVGAPWRTLRVRGVRWPWIEAVALAVLAVPFTIAAVQQGGRFFLKVVLYEVAAGTAVLFAVALRLAPPAPAPAGRAWRILFALSVLLATGAAGYIVLHVFDLDFLLFELGQPP